MITKDRSTKEERLILAGLLALGAALRIFYNNVTVFSRADETNYLVGARQLGAHFLSRFARFALDYANTPALWDSPPPVRWGHWWIISAACGLSTHCDYPTLAWVSTLGGIAALGFTWLLGKELFGSKPALVAVALSLASPLQLHLGRRALQDELVCATTLAALWSVARALDPERRTGSTGAHWLAVLFCTLALAEKETSLLWAPPLMILWLMRHRARGWCKRDLLFVLPPIFFVAGFFILTHSVTLFFRDAGGNLGTLAGSSYVAQLMSGPPHRYLIDLLTLAPIPFLLAIAACGALLLDSLPAGDTNSASIDNANSSSIGSTKRSYIDGARELAAMLFVALLVWAPTPKDVRYLTAADSLLSLLAAWLLVAYSARRRWRIAVAAGLVLLTIGSELAIFQRVFVVGGAYDPTTFEILRSLDAIPR